MENEQRTWEDWATEAFVGNNYYYYKTKWEHQNPDKSFTSWNWVAFFFPYYWLAFRKMYLNAFLFFIVNLLGSLIPFVGIAIHCLMGCYGNYLYLKRCRSTIHTASQYTNEEAKTYLNRQGGTSVLGLIVSILAMIASAALIIWALFTIGSAQETEEPSKQNTYDVVSINQDIIVSAPDDFEKSEEYGHDIYLTNYNSELIINIFQKKDYVDLVNEQYFMDLMIESLQEDYTLEPANNEALLSLDHQSPQALYSAYANGEKFYFYFTCEKFDEYYVQTIYTTPLSSWRSDKEQIADMVSSIRPNDSM